ncbi:hypothetical protein FACS1894103_1380 [Campylobacterota bacterium]|nr:hypothetical protein FACS1894103_1380 [Campylobacterota bacterium]
MKFTTELKLGTPIHHMILASSVVAFLDEKTTVRFLNPGTNKPAKLQPFEEPVEYAYYRGNSSSGDGSLLCLYFPQKKQTCLYELDKTVSEYKFKAILGWNVAGCEVSEFSNDGTLVAAGGNDGIVCIYRTDNAKLLTIAPRSNEYISAISFNKDNSLIAYASFKKTMTIFDLGRYTVLSGYSYKEVICTLAFLHRSSFVVVGARDNKVFLFDAIGGYMARELLTTINWPVAIYVDEEDQFCFVSDKAGYLFMIDLTTSEETKEPIYNSKEVIVDIKRRGELIYFAFEDGRVGIIDMHEERENFQNSIKEHNLQLMYNMMQANPILKFSAANMMNNMDDVFNKRFAKAVIWVAQGKNDQAKNEMGDLLEYPVYTKKFEAIVRHASKIITFWQLMQSGQYEESYKLANEGDFYRKLPLFDQLENRFKERFKDAIKNLNSEHADIKKAKEDLLLFMKVPIKEAVIKNMLKNPEIFNKAQKAYDQKNWQDLAGLIEKFKMLKGAPAVTDYQDMIKQEEEKFIGFMAAGRFDEAVPSAEFLKKNAKNDVVSLKIEFARLATVDSFKKIIQEKKYGAAMKMAIENPFLISSSAYKTLDEMLSLRFKAAHLYATKNHYEAVDKLLHPFLNNPFSSTRAICIYKTLYVEQISALGAQMQPKHWVNTFKNYVSRFGIDSELELLARRFDQDKLLESFREFKNPNFLRYPLIPNIVTTTFSRLAPSKPKPAA